METWDSPPLVTTGKRRQSSQFISVDDNLKADPRGFCCSADTLLRTKIYWACSAIIEIAFCESTARGQQQDTASLMFRAQTSQ